jgi:hypothetical protein
VTLVTLVLNVKAITVAVNAKVISFRVSKGKSRANDARNAKSNAITCPHLYWAKLFEHIFHVQY